MVNKMKKKWIALMITVMATCFAFAACNLSALLGGQSADASSSIEQEASSVESIDKESSSENKEDDSLEDSTEEDSSESSSEEDSLNGGRLEGDNDLVWGETQN